MRKNIFEEFIHTSQMQHILISHLDQLKELQERLWGNYLEIVKLGC